MVVRGGGLFCLGVWCLQQQARLPGLGWVLVFALVLVLRWMVHDGLGRLRQAVDLTLCLGAGVLWAAAVAHVRLATWLPAEWEGRDIAMQGVIVEMPRESDGDVRFAFAVERVLVPLGPALERIQLSWRTPPGNVLAGERWQFTVRLKRPHGTLNPHGFDREYWSLERGIQGVGYVRETAPALRLTAQVWRPAVVLERVRQALRTRIAGAVGDDAAAGVLAALAIGDQDAIDREQWRLFTRTGVAHLMSISGLHITMLSGLAALVTGFIWRRSHRLAARIPARKVALCAGLVVGAAYAALAGFGVPAQRTVLMLGVTVAGLLWARQWPAAAVLAAALWAVLLWDPFAVTAPGFWLSFGAVALMAYVAMGRLRAPRALVQWVRTQGALSIGLIPLSLLLFQQVSLVSPVANALAIPLVSLLVVPLTLVGMLLPFDAILHGAAYLMQACVGLLALLDRAAWAVWQQALPPGWALAVGVVGVLWCLAPRGFPGRAMGLLALLPGFIWRAPAPAAGAFWADVLDVGQGQAVLLRTQRHALLFDAGPGYGHGVDAGERIVLPHLRAEGVARLDGLVVSHDDQDHSGGAASVLTGIGVGWVASSLRPDHALLHGGVPSRPCGEGQHWTWDDVHFEFLHPSRSELDRANVKDNDRSCVLVVRAGGGTLLLPGDIEAVSERRLAGIAGHALRADVLLAPHHGSATSSTGEFLRAVAPDLVIVTNGYRNRHGHPRQEVLARYARMGARVMRSDRDGAVRLRVEGGSWRGEAWRDAHRRYWYD